MEINATKKEEKVGYVQLPADRIPPVVEVIRGPMRDEENSGIGLCSSITLIILAVFALNAITFLFGLFALVVVNGNYETWTGWRKTIKAFFYISLVVLIIAMIIAILYIIRQSIKINDKLTKKRFWILFASCVLLALSIVELIFLIRAYKAVCDLYPHLGEMIKKEVVYTASANVTSTNP